LRSKPETTCEISVVYAVDDHRLARRVPLCAPLDATVAAVVVPVTVQPVSALELDSKLGFAMTGAAWAGAEIVVARTSPAIIAAPAFSPNERDIGRISSSLTIETVAARNGIFQ